MTTRTTSRTSRAALAGVAVLTFIVGACGPAATATSTPAPVVTEAPIVTEAPGPANTGLPGLSLTPDRELESMIPDEIGGEAVGVMSMTGTDFLGSGSSSELDAMMQSLGKAPADLSVALGGTSVLSIGAFRVRGVPGTQILPALMTAYEEENQTTTEQITLGGKSVTKLTATGTSAGLTYVYTTGDTVFAVTGMGSVTDAILNELFQKLP